MAKGSLRVNGIIVDTDGELKASTGDNIVIREDDGSAVITVDTNGKTSIGGAMDVGVNDTGHDVKFFGATAGAYAEWDESADELELRGGAATPGKLLLSTAETTVVDGNKLGQIDFQAPLDSAGTDAILVGASIYAEADATFSASVNATELVFATGASEAAAEKMRIASNGYVGIGTTAPDHLLHVSQTAASGMGMLVYRNKNAANSDNALAKIHNDHIDDDQAALHVRQDSAGYAIHVECNTNTTNYGNGIAISTQDENTTSYPLYIGTNTTSVEAGNARFVVRADGKVGIGTSAPNTHLEVSDGVPTFRLNSTEGNVWDTDILGEISWKSADANRTGDPIAYIRALSENATGSATGLAFGTGFDSNNASERMRIKNSGNVGIG